MTSCKIDICSDLAPDEVVLPMLSSSQSAELFLKLTKRPILADEIYNLILRDPEYPLSALKLQNLATKTVAELTDADKTEIMGRLGMDWTVRRDALHRHSLFRR